MNVQGCFSSGSAVYPPVQMVQYPPLPFFASIP
jgi:hypothetical protein